MPTPKDYSLALRWLRRHLDMPEDVFARQIGLSPSYVRRLSFTSVSSPRTQRYIDDLFQLYGDGMTVEDAAAAQRKHTAAWPARGFQPPANDTLAKALYYHRVRDCASSRAAFAKQTGLPVATVSRAERGEWNSGSDEARVRAYFARNGLDPDELAREYDDAKAI